jgi:hypothetical protein
MRADCCIVVECEFSVIDAFHTPEGERRLSC